MNLWTLLLSLAVVVGILAGILWWRGGAPALLKMRDGLAKAWGVAAPLLDEAAWLVVELDGKGGEMMTKEDKLTYLANWIGDKAGLDKETARRVAQAAHLYQRAKEAWEAVSRK